MIDEQLSNAPVQVQSIKIYAKRLRDVTSLSSGIGLMELWNKWRCSDAITSPRHDSPQIRDLDKFLVNPAINPGRPALQSLVLFSYLRVRS
jgi:hypothetical protein